MAQLVEHHLSLIHIYSSNEHLYALIEHAAAYGVSDIRIHCFMDGRDVPPASGKSYICLLYTSRCV